MQFVDQSKEAVKCVFVKIVISIVISVLEIQRIQLEDRPEVSFLLNLLIPRIHRRHPNIAEEDPLFAINYHLLSFVQQLKLSQIFL